MTASPELLKALAVTAELTGTSLTIEAARIMAQDLDGYADHELFNALRRCRRELTGRLTVAHIIERIDDGRPGAEEAWALIPSDESGSCVWTDEMAHAYGIACQCDDRISARMAFKEAYQAAVRKARDQRQPAHWTPSLGHDPNQREAALIQAATLGRISHAHAKTLLPHLDQTERTNQPTRLSHQIDQKPHI